MTITLTKDELNLVVAGLSELPAKVSYNLITKLLSEANRPVDSQPPSE